MNDESKTKWKRPLKGRRLAGFFRKLMVPPRDYQMLNIAPLHFSVAGI